MSKIKVAIRKNMPETNSSSSHVVAIYGGDYTTKGLEEHLSDDNKILTIPGGAEFTRSREEFNDVISKMQYACYGFDYYPQNKAIFEEVVKDFLGVEEIKYDWGSSKLIEEWCEQNPDKEIEDCPFAVDPKDGHLLHNEPDIDHESVDTMLRQVYESKDTLKDFIFGSKSWLFSGEVTADPEDYYPALKLNKGSLILSIIPDGNILKGDKVDLELFPNFPYDKNIIEEGISYSYDWGRNSKLTLPKWICVYRENLPEHTLIVLSNLWIKEENGDYTLEVGNLPDKKKYSKILVPWITSNTFKSPFTMNFYPISMFDNIDPQNIIHQFKTSQLKNSNNEKNIVIRNKYDIKQISYDLTIDYPPMFSINLIPQFSHIKVNDYI